MKLLLLLSALLACHPASASPLSDAIAPILAADQPEALKRLEALNPGQLNAKDAATRRCVIDRFQSPSPTPVADASLPPEIDQLLLVFQRYWRRALMHQTPVDKAGDQLFDDLRVLLAMPGAGLEALDAAISARIEKAGYHGLTGRTAPLYELMVWRSQEDRDEQIALPEGQAAVPLSLLDGFASSGWTSWASCDATGTGGWASGGRIMVVRPAWKLDSEDYRVSLLGHEAQHVLDKQRFPQLESADLEFRAKLVELILARETQRELLAKFSRDARSDRSLPHPFADAQLIAGLRRRLGVEDLSQASSAQIRAAAEAELLAHTARLNRDSRTALPER